MRKTSRAVIIEDDKLLVFFRRRVRDDKEITYYALPGGHVEGDETCEQTVVRELKEEMNLDIEVKNYLGNLVVDNQEENYYYAKIIGGDLQFGGEELERHSEDNYYEIRWLPLGELDNSDIRSIDFIRRAIKLKNED